VLAAHRHISVIDALKVKVLFIYMFITPNAEIQK